MPASLTIEQILYPDRHALVEMSSNDTIMFPWLQPSYYKDPSHLSPLGSPG